MVRILKYEVTRFAIVGAVNFVLTFVIYFLLVRVFNTNHLLALIPTWLLGIAFSYVMNFSWVFKPEEQIQFKQRFWKYFSASLLSILLNILALHLIVKSTHFDPFYVQCALIPFIVIFNFSTAKFWSLRANG